MTENISTLITALVTAVTALGGWESVKYLLNRKTNKRKEEAETDLMEFHALAEINKTLQETYQSQTQRLRQTQDELFDMTAKYHTLKAVSDLKICEKRGCAMREPQTGY